MEKQEKREKRWKDNIKEWTLPAQLGQLKTGQDRKELLRSHLWCPNDQARLWDRLD